MNYYFTHDTYKQIKIATGIFHCMADSGSVEAREWHNSPFQMLQYTHVEEATVIPTMPVQCTKCVEGLSLHVHVVNECASHQVKGDQHTIFHNLCRGSGMVSKLLRPLLHAVTMHILIMIE